jgi:hypothetical protein
MLAKLLAKENINVSVGNYHTAFFDIKNRTLGLPTWNTNNKFVSDLLVGHEVGHALHTPSDGIERFKKHIPGAPFDIGNIVEDIRIERLVRDNYPGLVYSFNEGYKYFVENDFFKIKNSPIEKLGFIDRLNLRGKIGNLVQIPLNAEEEEIYSRCLAAETFDDVLNISKDIYDRFQKEKEKEKEKNSDQSQKQEDEAGDKIPSPDMSDDQEDEEENDSKDSNKKSDNSVPSEEEDESDEEEEDSQEQSDGTVASSNKEGTNDVPSDNNKESVGSDPNHSDGDDEVDQLESVTQNEFDSNLKELQQVMDYYVVNSPTKEQVMNCITPVDKIMEARRMCSSYNAAMNNPEFVESFVKFKTSTKKHIAVLVKEFERRKSAYQYSRSRQSDSGSINVNRLHSYKFEDQIFKSVTTLADAKSHGMVFIIDYSGSMRYTLEDVVDQTLQLVYFCKAVGIPFEVYGFTGPEDIFNKSVKKSFGLNIVLDHNAHVFELLNSGMKKDKFELSVRELKAQLFNFNNNAGGRFNIYTKYERMSSTPLLETLIIAHEIVKNFKAKHKVQKMNTIFLTDGDGARLRFDDNISDANYRKEVKPHTNNFNRNYKIKVHGREIAFSQTNSHYSSADKKLYMNLIENLKITCGTTVVGFFIAQNQRDLKANGIDSFLYNSENNKNEIGLGWSTAMESFKIQNKKSKKDKCMFVKGAFGYDAYFIFENTKNLTIDEEESFQTESLKGGKSFTETSVQNKLAKDFAKFTSEKRNSRVFLNKFAEIIA